MSLLKYESQVRAPLVDGDKDYHQVTEDIVRPIEAKPSTLMVDWFYHLCCLAAVWCLFCLPGSYLWYRAVEPEQNHRMGLGYHQLRLVGRYWSRRYTDLCDPIACSARDGEQV